MNPLEYMDVLINAIQQEPILSDEGLPITTEALLDEFNIKITRSGITLHVDMAPKSGEGHDYMFTVNTDTGLIDPKSIAIGEVLPEPGE